MNMIALVSDSLVDRVSIPEVEPPFELRVYVRDLPETREVRFISDGVPVEQDARLADVAIFMSQDDADHAAKACDALLTLSGWRADESGWHTIPSEPETLIATLLSAARKNAEVRPFAPENETPAKDLVVHAIQIPPRQRRRWSRHKEARFCFMMGQGYSAKQVAYDPEIRSTPDACYQRAREVGLSFREVPTGQVSMRVPIPLLLYFDKVAAESGRTREAIIEGWLNKLAGDLQRTCGSADRYGLVAI